jgi:hypothetical protein
VVAQGWQRPGGHQPRGWNYPIGDEGWREIGAFFENLAEKNPSLRPVVEIVRSIEDSDVSDHLVGATSMADLLVAERPTGSPPIPVVVVSVAGSPRFSGAQTGHVVIAHLSSTGHDDQIERPSDEAVPLFWRFVREKFDILGILSSRSLYPVVSNR